VNIDLDTSVVLRLITGQPPEQLETARACVSASPIPVTVSDLVVAESYHALRYHYGVPHADAVDALAEFIGDPRIHATGVARGVLAEPATRLTTKATAGFVDRLIHATAASEHATLVTFDKALARLPGVELLREAP
jgi:predicted nucleic acid-binding protein